MRAPPRLLQGMIFMFQERIKLQIQRIDHKCTSYLPGSLQVIGMAARVSVTYWAIWAGTARLSFPKASPRENNTWRRPGGTGTPFSKTTYHSLAMPICMKISCSSPTYGAKGMGRPYPTCGSSYRKISASRKISQYDLSC